MTKFEITITVEGVGQLEKLVAALKTLDTPVAPGQMSMALGVSKEDKPRVAFGVKPYSVKEEPMVKDMWARLFYTIKPKELDLPKSDLHVRWTLLFRNFESQTGINLGRRRDSYNKRNGKELTTYDYARMTQYAVSKRLDRRLDLGAELYKIAKELFGKENQARLEHKKLATPV
jgi:hypothetical protein